MGSDRGSHLSAETNFARVRNVLVEEWGVRAARHDLAPLSQFRCFRSSSPSLGFEFSEGVGSGALGFSFLGVERGESRFLFPRLFSILVWFADSCFAGDFATGLKKDVIMLVFVAYLCQCNPIRIEPQYLLFITALVRPSL